jgi:quercetin dioxygenase-like cupin family protein
MSIFEIYSKTPLIVKKDWGHELIFANNSAQNYCGKILHIKKGHKFSMHFHDVKQETFYVLKGLVKVCLVDVRSKNGDQSCETFHPGVCIDIPRLLPHQIEALEDSEIIEASTFHRDEDSYRIWR